MELFVDFKPVATVLHVLSVVFAMGGALTSDLLFTFYSKDRKLSKSELFTLHVLSHVVWYGLVFVFLSGAMLFASDIPKYLASDKFLSKMTILLVLCLNGFFLHRVVWPHVIKRNFFTMKKEAPIRKLAFACGAISVTSWLSVCALGVLDKVNMDYVKIMSLYIGVLMIAVPVALLIEDKELERKIK